MSDAAVDPAEERARLAALAVSVPLLLFAAPTLLSFDGHEPIVGKLEHDATRFSFFVLAFMWPVIVAVVGLRGALRRRAPGLAAYTIPALAHLLAAGLVLVAALSACGSRSSARAEPMLWFCLVVALAVLGVLIRGFFRQGFRRWMLLCAAVWLTHAAFTALLSIGQRDLFARPALGAWIYLFALAGALPPLAWALAARPRPTGPA